MITADPKSISLEDLQKLAPKLPVFLYLTKRWMEWADSGAGEARIISVDAKMPGMLNVSFSGGVFGTEQIPYDNRMKFLIRK